MAGCPHLANLGPLPAGAPVYREECTQCFEREVRRATEPLLLPLPLLPPPLR